MDQPSRDYAEEWLARSGVSQNDLQFRVETARDDVQKFVAGLFDPSLFASTELNGSAPGLGMNRRRESDSDDGSDPLKECPPELKAKVLIEIKHFRDNASLQDAEKMKKEERLFLEAQRRRRAAEGDNSIPSGPRSMRPGQGTWKDRRAVPNGDFDTIDHQMDLDQDTDASDYELEQRRVRWKNASRREQQDEWIKDLERRDNLRIKSYLRDTTHKEKIKDKHKERAAELADKLAGQTRWDESREPYFKDRSRWSRENKNRLAMEKERDEAEEGRREEEQRARDLGLAENFLAEQAHELQQNPQSQPQPSPFKFSLGAAAQKAQEMAECQRTFAEMEVFLGDEDDGAAATETRTLKPIEYDAAAEMAKLTDDERADLVNDLAQSIPMDLKELGEWNLKWDYITERVLTEQLRPFVEKQIVDYLGVQETELVDALLNSIREKQPPQEVVEMLQEVRLPHYIPYHLTNSHRLSKTKLRIW